MRPVLADTPEEMLAWVKWIVRQRLHILEATQKGAMLPVPSLAGAIDEVSNLLGTLSHVEIRKGSPPATKALFHEYD